MLSPVRKNERAILKTIALFDDSIGGHRDAFMQLFIKACLENNVRVVCFYPKTEPLAAWVQQHYEEYQNRVHFVRIDTNDYQHVHIGRWQSFRDTLSIWKSLGTLMKNTERDLKLNIDLVFFNWIDSYMTALLPGFLVDLVFPFKWSGLYFHPRLFRMEPEFLNKKVNFRDLDSIFNAKKCVAVTIHDEGILQGYAGRIGKKVLLFPEIADDTPPNPQQLLAYKIKSAAKGRTVVGIIGLQPHKGPISLIRLVKQADPQKFFFAFTGVYHEEHLQYLSAQERQELTHFMNHLPENCLWQTGALQEGMEYNSVFCSFDIIYIMYRNFYSSSNRLTKAAIFHRLVLGNNYGCVGDDIPRYQLGETADEANIEEQCQKMEILRNKIQSGNLPIDQWKIYSEKHSTNRLKEKFEELLNLV